MSGGYMSEGAENFKRKIILCEDKTILHKGVLTHELIHAFDDCRGKIDFSNCQQHACTEVIH
jgi:mitochondrial inner membrane protease ATP23